MILDEIVKNKKKEIAALKRKRPLSFLKKETAKLPKKNPSFFNALKRANGIVVIAEIKKKSPSKGVLRQDFKPVEIAREYAGAGASALSVLTDIKFFSGSTQILTDVKSSVHLPVLRKDFILDEYQLYESRLIGADAVLLIAGLLSKKKLRVLSRIASGLGLDVLYEVHSKKEITKIKSLDPKLVGVNNRDLKTFRVDLRTTEKLRPYLPKGALLVSESGIKTHKDLLYLKRLGAKAVLVGESLMTQKNIGAALRRLLGK